MLVYNRPTTTLYIYAVLVHVAGVIICTTVTPDINLTPPLEFPSDGQGLPVKIGQVITNNSTKSIIIVTTDNDDKITINKSNNELQNNILKRLNNLPSQSINIIANISKNVTENYIKNKYYNNQIEESLSPALTLGIILVMVFLILGCSALCMKKVQNLKVSKTQLLIEDYDESAMSDLIHVV